jgi:hypothetical protein
LAKFVQCTSEILANSRIVNKSRKLNRKHHAITGVSGLTTNHIKSQARNPPRFVFGACFAFPISSAHRAAARLLPASRSPIDVYETLGGQTEVWPPKRRKSSAERFHGTLEGWVRLLKIASDHDWFAFNARVERQKPWLDDFGEL